MAEETSGGETGFRQQTAAQVFEREAQAEHDATDINPEDLLPPPLVLPPRHRVVWTLAILLVLVLLAVLPPLINVNRFRRQIAQGISESLGRPVHMDQVTLDLLPLPGFTLTRFVVSEDPAFGYEPVIYADTVRVRLRWRSLWHRHLEFSRISLEGASVNLVHLPGNQSDTGRWNIESILLQASRIPALPTAQKSAGSAPRFPYIEAKGARLNLKMGLEKMPLALTDAEFSLWLPKENQWRLRLEAHPSRTDTAATDTGIFRLEGTLGKAARLEDLPVELQAGWTAAPLGAASWVLLGRDAGLRGEMNLTASVAGTVGKNISEARLELARVRRADFVPARPLNATIDCKAQALDVFHRLADLACKWPADAKPEDSQLILTGDVPNLRAPATADVVAQVNKIPLELALDILRTASPRVSPALTASGTVTGHWTCCTTPEAPHGEGELTPADAKLAFDPHPVYVQHDDPTGSIAGTTFALTPIPLDLGAPQPALLTLTATATGYTLHLTGTALRSRLLEFAKALPQFGDGLEDVLPDEADATQEAQPLRLDLTGTRTWTGGLLWTQPPTARPAAPRKTKRHH